MLTIQSFPRTTLAPGSYELSFVNASWLGEVNAAHYAGVVLSVHAHPNATATQFGSKRNANVADKRLAALK